METGDLLNNIKKYSGVVVLIGVNILFRLIPHLPNMAPIGALALFSGAHYRGKKMILVPLTALLISDFFLGFYKEMIFVYGSFLLILLLGILLRKREKAPYLIGASLLSSIIFFIITNFGVWIMSSWYAKNMTGLLNAYLLAIPFFRNTVIGDFAYTFSFFYGYKYISLFIKNNNYLVSKILKISK